MTPDERQFAATRLRELSGQIRDRLGLLDGHIAERELFLKAAESVAVLAEVLAAVIEDPLEASRCPWWTNGNSWALWAGPPSKRQCVRRAGHGGDHR